MALDEGGMKSTELLPCRDDSLYYLCSSSYCTTKAKIELDLSKGVSF